MSSGFCAAAAATAIANARASAATIRTMNSRLPRVAHVIPEEFLQLEHAFAQRAARLPPLLRPETAAARIDHDRRRRAGRPDPLQRPTIAARVRCADDDERARRMRPRPLRERLRAVGST